MNTISETTALVISERNFAPDIDIHPNLNDTNTVNLLL